MKTISFKNCVGKDRGLELVDELPDPRIYERANFLLIDDGCVLNLVKRRTAYLKADGTEDLKKLLQKISETKFTEITSGEFVELIDKCQSVSHVETMKNAIDKLFEDGSNILFRL